MNTAACSYVAMTRAADRLIVGGCMPGNMNSVRKFSWYDLITKGLANSGLQLQEIETTAGAVKRYTRAEEAPPPRPGRRAGRNGAPIALPSWLQTPAPSEAAAGSLLRPSDPADDDGHPVRTGESIELRARAPCSAARWCTGCCNRCPISRPSAAATPPCPISPAMPTAGPTTSARRWRKGCWP